LAAAIVTGERPVAALRAGTALGWRAARFGGAPLAALAHQLSTGKVEAVVRATITVLLADAAVSTTLGAAKAAIPALAFAFALAVVLVFARSVAAVAAVLALGLGGAIVERME
jgi:hypothetical protein